MGGLHAVPHLALRGGHRRLPRHQPVGHRRQRVDIGIPAGKFRRRILLRCRIARVQLAFQLAAAGAQRQRAVAGQHGGAVNGQKDVVRADAPVDQPRLVQKRHALHHRLQQGAGLGGGQRPGFQRQVMRQRHALLAFLHAVDGVVLLDHVHNAGKPGGRRQPVQIVVQVLKVHPAGLEQYLAPGLGHQRAVGAAAVAQRHGEIFLDAHKPLFLVVHAAVAQPVAVGAQVFANGVFARQLGAKGQRALRVFVVQAFAAMGALAMKIHLDRLQAVRAGDLLLHPVILLCLFFQYGPDGLDVSKRAARCGACPVKKRPAAARWGRRQAAEGTYGLPCSGGKRGNDPPRSQRSRSSSFSRLCQAFCTSSSSSRASSSLAMLAIWSGSVRVVVVVGTIATSAEMKV